MLLRRAAGRGVGVGRAGLRRGEQGYGAESAACRGRGGLILFLASWDEVRGQWRRTGARGETRGPPAQREAWVRGAAGRARGARGPAQALRGAAGGLCERPQELRRRGKGRRTARRTDLMRCANAGRQKAHAVINLPTKLGFVEFSFHIRSRDSSTQCRRILYGPQLGFWRSPADQICSRAVPSRADGLLKSRLSGKSFRWRARASSDQPCDASEKRFRGHARA